MGRSAWGVVGAAVVRIALAASPPASPVEHGPDKVRVYVNPEPASSVAVPVLAKHLRQRKTLRVVLDAAEADVREHVLSAGIVGERRLVVVDKSDPRTHLGRPIPPAQAGEAEVVDTRRYVIVVSVVAGDRAEELRDAPRAITLRAAAKAMAGEIEGWIKRHRAEILTGRRAERDGD